METYNYHGDPRVIEAYRTRYYEVIAIHKTAAIIQLTDQCMESIHDDETRVDHVPAGFPVFTGFPEAIQRR